MCFWPQDLWCFCEFKSPHMHSKLVSPPPIPAHLTHGIHFKGNALRTCSPIWSHFKIQFDFTTEFAKWKDKAINRLVIGQKMNHLVSSFFSVLFLFLFHCKQNIFIFWTVGRTKPHIWRRHLGSSETVICVFHHFHHFYQINYSINEKTTKKKK